MSGNPSSRFATRTFSRAAPRSIPTRHDSQCAHDSAPARCQPSTRSNSRSWVKNRCVATSMIAAVSAIASPSAAISSIDRRFSFMADY